MMAPQGSVRRAPHNTPHTTALVAPHKTHHTTAPHTRADDTRAPDTRAAERSWRGPSASDAREELVPEVVCVRIGER